MCVSRRSPVNFDEEYVEVFETSKWRCAPFMYNNYRLLYVHICSYVLKVGGNFVYENKFSNAEIIYY